MFLQDQFTILKVLQPEFQHLTDPHASPGHQFKHESIPGFGGSKNDFIHGFFFNDFPFGNDPFTILFPDHGRVAWITQFVIEIVADEIEEGTNVGIADTLGVGLAAFGESIQKSQDIVG
ncbi:MAG: hypothetical protein PVG19_00170 [Desulfobacterales bacterium]